MKFLVITRPNGADHGLDGSRMDAVAFSSEIKRLHASKVLEASYAFIGGGSAYVVKANTAHELALLVRTNPLFKSQSHEIIPVADATDFLDGYAKHLA